METAKQEMFPVRAESPRYDGYVQRMLKLRRILDAAVRHRVALMLATVALIVMVLGFLSAIGLFIRMPQGCEYVYGEQTVWAAKAFLSSVRYQYAPVDEETAWVDGTPTALGEYRLRAVSANGFGKERFSETVTVTVLPRSATVQVRDGQIVYGNEPLEAAQSLTDIQGLADGDAVYAWVHSLVQDAGGYAVTVDQVKIRNSSGADVTDCYAITFSGGFLTEVPRTITVSAVKTSKVYDGQPMEVTAALTAGKLVGEDQLQIQLPQIPAEVGVYTLLPECTVVNADGKDVTDKYVITVLSAEATISKRPITVVSENGEKVYDGTPLTRGWRIAEGTIAAGQKLVVKTSGSRTEAGVSDNTISCIVVDWRGSDVSENYELTVRMGTLKVSKRSLFVTTDSAEKLYDGKTMTAPGWRLTAGEVAPNQTLTGTVTGSQKAAGESKNSITLSVTDAAGNDVTANYQITIKAGTLTVKPIVLKFETDSAEKVYDGNALSAKGCRLLEGQVLAGHRLEFRTVTKMGTVGTASNRLEVHVWDKNGKDVRDEGYKIEVDFGTLTVTPRPITIQSGSAEKLYDGKPLTYESFTITEGSLGNGGRAHSIEKADFTGSQTRVGSSSNTFTVVITNGYGSDVTHCYDITYVYGTLTVHENPNHPDSGGGSGTGSGGDGQTTGKIADPSVPIRIGYPGAIADTIYAQVKGISGLHAETKIYFRQASFGDYTGDSWLAAETFPKFHESFARSALAYIGAGLYYANEKAAEMEITRINGCPVLLPYYTYGPNGVEAAGVIPNDCYFDDGGYLVYDVDVYTGWSYGNLKGISLPAFYAEHEKIYREFVYDHYLQIPESTKQALLKWAVENGISADSSTLVEDIQTAIKNAAVYNINGEDYPEGVDVAVYFLTEAKEGICQHFATAATLMYRAFGIPARYTVGFMDTVKNGATTDLTSKDAHAWVEIYVDGLGWVPMEVTGSNTVLEVKTELHIHAVSMTKYYDGKPFTKEEMSQYMIASGQLREGHKLVVEKMFVEEHDGSPGEWLTHFWGVRVLDENGEDVTKQYYRIYLGSGTVTILKRKITITIGSASKVYDGTPLSCSEYWISEGNLVPGHTLTVEIDASRTEPGTTENKVQKVTIYNDKNEDVSAYYEIELVYGTLEVLPEEEP